MKRYILLLPLLLACSNPTEPGDDTDNWARMTFTLAEDPQAAINGNPHVCVPLFGSPYCPICAANKSMPDSVVTDYGGGWEPPIPTLWGGWMGNQQ